MLVDLLNIVKKFAIIFLIIIYSIDLQDPGSFMKFLVLNLEDQVVADKGNRAIVFLIIWSSKT